MRYVKLILVTVTITTAAGFVIWNLLWMAQVEKEFRTGRASGTVNKTEIRGSKSEGLTEKRETITPAAEDRTAPRNDPASTNQPVTAPQERAGQTENKYPRDTKPLVSGIKEGPEQDTGKWFEKDTMLGNKVRKPGLEKKKTDDEIVDNKTMSVTIRNSANPPAQNISSPAPMKVPDVQVPAATHPSSTAP
ncbi:MAG: hypothetical protein AB1499_12955 [Nitrospirota bacterium]